MYTKLDKGNVLVVGVYVDDLLVTSSNKKEIKDQFKLQMNKQFEMSNLGLLSFYLGIEVRQIEHYTTLKQLTYAKKLLDKFDMMNCDPCECPMDTEI